MNWCMTLDEHVLTEYTACKIQNSLGLKKIQRMREISECSLDFNFLVVPLFTTLLGWLESTQKDITGKPIFEYIKKSHSPNNQIQEKEWCTFVITACYFSQLLPDLHRDSYLNIIWLFFWFSNILNSQIINIIKYNFLHKDNSQTDRRNRKYRKAEVIVI